MIWTAIEHETFCEQLADQHGVIIGHVERFYEDAPTYAWAHGNRLGVFQDDASAKAAVEAQHKRGMG